MKRIIFCLSLFLFATPFCSAQEFAARTNDLFLNFKKPSVKKGLPLISCKSHALESSISPFPSFIVEALVSSDVELRSVSFVFRNGDVLIGERNIDVKDLKEKKVRQKLTLNDGR